MDAPLDRFNTAIGELLGQSHDRIVLDLEAVPTMDSSGIGMLFATYIPTNWSSLFRPIFGGREPSIDRRQGLAVLLSGLVSQSFLRQLHPLRPSNHGFCTVGGAASGGAQQV